MCHSEKSFQNMHLGTAHRPFLNATHKYLIWGCLIHFETTPFFYKTSVILPPPMTVSPSYSTTDCPAVMARWGSSNSTLAKPFFSG